MSLLTLQVGQCGNQIAHELFGTLVASCSPQEERDSDRVQQMYFREAERGLPVARSVLVDMEPKVITKCLSLAKGRGFEYGTSVLTKQDGSANNWAYGYNVQGLCHIESILEKVRQEVEHIDSVKGISLVHSVAGGTGSGVGSCILEHMRDAHPHTPFISFSVLPLHDGEIATQHYNTVFTLAHLQRYTDATVLLDNTSLLKQLEREQDEAGRRGGTARQNRSAINFEVLNKRIVDDISGGVLLPSRFASFSGNALQQERRVALYHDFVESMVQGQGRKFVSLFSTRVAEGIGARWNVCMQDISRQMQRCGGTPSRALLSVRGVLSMPEGGLAKVDVADPGRLFGHGCRIAKGMAVRASGGSVVMAANESSAVQTAARRVGTRTKEMLSCGAYLHHFEKYGMERDDCLAALANVDQVVKDYSIA